jgi:hypothetical protein
VCACESFLPSDSVCVCVRRKRRPAVTVVRFSVLRQGARRGGYMGPRSWQSSFTDPGQNEFSHPVTSHPQTHFYLTSQPEAAFQISTRTPARTARDFLRYIHNTSPLMQSSMAVYTLSNLTSSPSHACSLPRTSLLLSIALLLLLTALVALLLLTTHRWCAPGTAKPHLHSRSSTHSS